MTGLDDIDVDQLWTNGVTTIQIMLVTEYNVSFNVVAGEEVEKHYMSKINLLMNYRLV